MRKRKREKEDDGGEKTAGENAAATVGNAAVARITTGDDMNADIVWQTPANPPQKQDYIFHNGRRHVRPYYFEFISHVKNRWAGKTIVDLFAEEFKGRPREYYVSAVKCGRIQVDGEMVPVSYIVRSSQKISHFLHRHEPPVMAWDVEILQKEPDILTVCKPASVPVHPCGQYRKNTVIGILQADHDLAPLFPVHRLDRLVSGLLILARNAAKADLFRQQIEAGMVKKQYIAKVLGIFPEDEKAVDANVDYNAREGRSTAETANGPGDNPLKGKPASTKFTRISTNGTHSIVLCEPITGRTHQIRVHLQYTGHPIANDRLYLSKHVNNRSTEGMSADIAAKCNSDMRNKTRVSGYIVFGTLDLVGLMNANIRTGQPCNSGGYIYLAFPMAASGDFAFSAKKDIVHSNTLAVRLCFNYLGFDSPPFVFGILRFKSLHNSKLVHG